MLKYVSIQLTKTLIQMPVRNSLFRICGEIKKACFAHTKYTEWLKREQKIILKKILT